MIITAVAVGTRGDVDPLAELGEEMIRRGHQHQCCVLVDIAAPHPFDEAIRTFLCRDHELLIAGFGFAEGLDNLDAVDVFHGGII